MVHTAIFIQALGTEQFSITPDMAIPLIHSKDMREEHW
jgi:plasmid maintenance system antidote protein VapI